MQIDCDLDAGNIEVLDASDPARIELAIRLDVGGEHSQWFHFRVRGAAGQDCCFVLTNASKTSYPTGWEDYRACASTDGETWFRLPTVYEGGELRFSHRPDVDEVLYAYFAPFDLERHEGLLAKTAAAPGVERIVLGQTLDGRDLDGLILDPIDDSVPSRTAWIIARQHPGETMAQWWMEGFLARLSDTTDTLAQELRAAFRFYVVPNMNPDGSVRGHLRVNAVGANLNREWETPTAERSPEVLVVRDLMDEFGVDFCLDVHGDEALPYNFISAAEGIPGWTPRLDHLTETFKFTYEAANPDFQRVHGYPLDKPGQANMTMCSNQVAQRFDCLAMTLEMPFKDNANAPNAQVGWSPERCRQLGRSVLWPLAAVMGELR
jgi:murein tripeptide amidase MpaA